MMMIMMMMNYVQSNLPITRINIVVVFFIVIRTHSPGDVIRHPCRPWHGCWYGRMYCITCNTYMYCDRALWCWHTNKTRSRKSKSSEAEENRFYSDHYSDIDPCGGRTRITVIDCFPLVVEWSGWSTTTTTSTISTTVLRDDNADAVPTSPLRSPWTVEWIGLWALFVIVVVVAVHHCYFSKSPITHVQSAHLW